MFNKVQKTLKGKIYYLKASINCKVNIDPHFKFIEFTRSHIVELILCKFLLLPASLNAHSITKCFQKNYE